jgi:hypothetical protein
VAAPAAAAPLALTLDASPGTAGEAQAGGEGAEPLDVPAFMRRVKQA